jgi:hypothetical protein
MSVYARDDERAIRVQRLLRGWQQSGLITGEQHDRMLPDVRVDLRRTNLFLRGTLFVFTLMIIMAAAGLITVLLDLNDRVVAGVMALVGAGACFATAQWSITSYKLYRFGVEEAAAIAAAVFAVVSGWLLLNEQWSIATLYAFAAATIVSLALYRRFGFVYAGVAAVFFATCVVFDLQQSDTFRRLFAMILLLTIFFFSRERRQDHDWDFPADTYAAFEAVAWAGLYLVANLKISDWLSQPDDVMQFYWATYGLIWLLPAAGLAFAIADRHRLMLDANIVLAILTLSTNKAYLGAASKPWDPLVFGVMLILVSLGLRRWLASGPQQSRRGFVAHRLLESEKTMVSIAGSATVLAPGAPAPGPRTQEPPPPFGGGRSGGAGASGSF